MKKLEFFMILFQFIFVTTVLTATLMSDLSNEIKVTIIFSFIYFVIRIDLGDQINDMVFDDFAKSQYISFKALEPKQSQEPDNSLAKQLIEHRKLQNFYLNTLGGATTLIWICCIKLVLWLSVSGILTYLVIPNFFK